MLTDTAVTDSTGRYQISVPAGAYNVTVQKSGYSAVSQNFTLVANEITVFSTPINAVVPSADPISANLIGEVLLNTTDEPLPNIPVRLFKNGVNLASSTTTPEGKFIFQSQSAGMYEIGLAEDSVSYNPATYVVHILNDGTLSPEEPKLYLSAKILGEDDTVVYHALATGTVYDMFSKAPLQYVTCSLKGVGSTVSDLNGGFVFQNLVPGTYELTLTRDGWSTLVTNLTVRVTAADPDVTEILPSTLSFTMSQSPEVDRGSVAGRYVDEITGSGVDNLIVRIYTFRLETRNVTVSYDSEGNPEKEDVSEWTLYSAAPKPVVSTKTGDSAGDFDSAGSFRLEHIEPSTLAASNPADETPGYVVYVGTGNSNLAGVAWQPHVDSEYTWYLPGSSVEAGAFVHKWDWVKVKPNTTTYLHNYDNPYEP
ncbi:MAG: hypothetical protein ACD_39C01418G0003 [uncultured bacterium]|nr:MAG: hypothetical protein ACD_39C01418G0003 [uncultured bacterium]